MEDAHHGLRRGRKKTIGVAVSDPLGWTAQGVTVIRRVSLEQDLAALKTLVREHEVGKIVVGGLPRRTDGSYGPETEKMYQSGGKN